MPDQEAIRLLIADDHPIFRAGIVSMLSADPSFSVVAQAENGQQAIDAYRVHQPDVVVLDLNMPGLDGLATISLLKQEWPAVRIVVLTSLAGDATAVKAIKAGAQAYLLKTALRTELLAAIRSVLAGQRYLPEAVAVDIAFHTADRELTSREIEVLDQVAKWGANKRVATQMGLSEGTVKVHMKSVLSKLGAEDRTQAVAIAIRRGIISA